MQWKKFFSAIIVCQLAGVVGSMFTVSAIPTWYATLTKPSWNPPSWVFGPAWTTLYTLMGISLYRIWGKSKNRIALFWFYVQLFMNAIWSIIFFGQKNLSGAFVEILILLGLILVVVHKFYRIDSIAAYLLVPYVAWVSFATYLTYTIWMLNP